MEQTINTQNSATVVSVYSSLTMIFIYLKNYAKYFYSDKIYLIQN